MIATTMAAVVLSGCGSGKAGAPKAWHDLALLSGQTPVWTSPDPGRKLSSFNFQKPFDEVCASIRAELKVEDGWKENVRAKATSFVNRKLGMVNVAHGKDGSDGYMLQGDFSNWTTVLVSKEKLSE